MGPEQGTSLPPGHGRIRDTKPLPGRDLAEFKSFLLLITFPPASSHPLRPLMSTGGTKSKRATAVD